MTGGDLGSMVAHLKLDIKNFKNSLNTASDEVKKTADSFRGIESAGNALKGVGATLTASITAPVAAIGATAMKTGMEFESAMSNVQALSGATSSEMKNMEEVARNLGKSTVYSATECADALGYMALAGWDANESTSALPGVLNLAAASGMDLAMASDMVTDYLSAFGEKADQAGRMADVLAYAQSKSNTTTAQLGEAFKNCAANANAFGLDVEQTTALLGKLADQGLKGSEAGTALTAVFRDITQKMKNGAIEIGNTSIKVQDAKGNFRELTDILVDVEKATKGMGDAEKQAALKGAFTADSIKALNILMQTGSGDIKKFEEALRDAGGTAEEVAGKKTDNLRGDIENLKGAFSDFGITVYEKVLPAIRPFVQGLTKLLEGLSKLPAPVLTFIMTLVGIVAAAGPVLLILGSLMSSISSIRGGFLMLKALNFAKIFTPILHPVRTIIKLFTTVGKVLALPFKGLFSLFNALKGVVMNTLLPALKALWGVLMANPIILIIAAITALVAAFIYCWNNVDGFKEFWINTWETIKTTCINAWNSVVNFFTVTMPEWFNGIVQWFAQLPSTIWNYLLSVVESVGNWISQMVQRGIEAGSGFVNGVVNFIKNLPGRVWNFLVNCISRVGSWVGQMSSKAIQGGSRFINGVVNFIRTLPGRVWSFLSSTIGKAATFVSSMGSKASQAARLFISKITGGLASLPGKMWNIGKSIVTGIINGITGAAGRLYSTLSNLANRALNSAKKALKINSPSRAFRDVIGANIPLGIVDGVEKTSNKAYESVRKLARGLLDNTTLPEVAISQNIRTEQMSSKGIRREGESLAQMEQLSNMIAIKTAPIDYDKLKDAFTAGAKKVNNTIVMDKTIVGKTTAPIIEKANKINISRLNRLEGVE